jgi:hypothetical protein
MFRHHEGGTYISVLELFVGRSQEVGSSIVAAALCVDGGLRRSILGCDVNLAK